LDEKLFFSFNAWRLGSFQIPPEIVRRDIHDRGMKYLQAPEILILSGLRQTGKSTLMFQMIADLLAGGYVPPERIFYFTLDDFSLRQELSASHAAFLTIMERLLGGYGPAENIFGGIGRHLPVPEKQQHQFVVASRLAGHYRSVHQDRDAPQRVSQQ